MWHCLNVVCGPEGRASGVLLRAGEIKVGADLARKRRISARHEKELAKGPARLATALDVDRALNGTDLCYGPCRPTVPTLRHPTPPRAGVQRYSHGCGRRRRSPALVLLDRRRPHGEPVPRPRPTP
jgi:hypothetical protein